LFEADDFSLQTRDLLIDVNFDISQPHINCTFTHANDFMMAA